MSVCARVQAPLNREFVPAVLWNREYLRLAESTDSARDVVVVIARPDGEKWSYRTKLLPCGHALQQETEFYMDRLVKALLWIYGGSRIEIAGASEIAEMLAKQYTKQGERAFEVEILAEKMFGEPLTLMQSDFCAKAAAESTHSIGVYTENDARYAVGLDLGGTSIKYVTRCYDEIVQTRQLSWAPYEANDPQYHIDKINEAVELAVSALPKVESIGVSIAGLFYGDTPKISALFQSVGRADFERAVQPMFRKLSAKFGDVPVVLLNDGAAAALSGAQALHCGEVMGISLGTSMAGGSVDVEMCPSSAMNEFAFVPVDYSASALRDAWSNSLGCGVDYCSQQAVAKLALTKGLATEGMSHREALAVVHRKCREHDPLAIEVFRTIGVYVGYSIAHLCHFMPAKVVMLMGGVTSGFPGETILAEAQHVLRVEFPELFRNMKVQLADESMKSYGQAIAVSKISYQSNESCYEAS